MNTLHGHGRTEPAFPNLKVLSPLLPTRFDSAPPLANNSVRSDGASLPTLMPHQTAKERSEGARKIEQTIQYMMEHLDQPLQVAELAESAHTSPSHFFVLFKRWVGLSPIDYFIRLRMRQACRLLAATSMSVKEVAAALGYDDPFYFSRVFKSVNGAPPSGYRTMIEEQAHHRGGMACVGEDMPLPRLPLADRVENHGGGGRIFEQYKLPSARRMMSLP